MGTRSETRARVGPLVALVVATVAFGAAQAFRLEANPWIANAIAALVALSASGLVLGNRVSKLFVVKLAPLVVALGLGVFLILVSRGAYLLAIEVVPSLAPLVEGLYGEIAAQDLGPVATPALVGVVVVAEELVWRGLVFELFAGRSRLAVVVGSSLLYAIPQLIGGMWILALAALALGIVLSLQRLRDRSLVGPVVTHAVWSLATFYYWPLVS